MTIELNTMKDYNILKYLRTNGITKFISAMQNVKELL